MDNNKNLDLKQVIGVDLGGTNVRAGRIEDGKIIEFYSSKLPQTPTNSQWVIDCIIATIKKVFNSNVTGIGIGVPGLVDKSKGIIHTVINIPSFKSIPLKNIVYEQFKVPVKMNNDVNCFALGEKFYGAGKKFRNMVGLSLGTGMGAGIISGNKLLEDANGGSGEFGEVPYRDANFEAYCSGQFFKNKLNLWGEEVFELAENGNEEAIKTYKEFGMHLGKVIHLIILTLDPQAIILGGSVSRSRKYFHHAMMDEVRRFKFTNSLKGLKIEYAAEKNSPTLGAAKLLDI